MTREEYSSVFDRTECPMCGSEMWHSWGSRGEDKGEWNICKGKLCSFMEFAADSGEYSVAQYPNSATSPTPSRYVTDGTHAATPKVANDTKAWPVYYRMCNHWRDRIKVGEYKVMVSAATDAPKKNTKKVPDLGVYLSASWPGMMSPIWGAGIKTPIGIGGHTSIYCPWPDYNVVDLSVVEWLVKTIKFNMEAGLMVDIGCQGAHGRTGTLLACLIARVEGLDAKGAMKAVRSRHCSKAIESRSQENLIREFCGEEPVAYAEEKEWSLYVGNNSLTCHRKWGSNDKRYLL